jgi:hypothetical protein
MSPNSKRIPVLTGDVRVDHALYRIRVWLDTGADPTVKAIAEVQATSERTARGIREQVVRAALSIEIQEIEHKP